MRRLPRVYQLCGVERVCGQRTFQKPHRWPPVPADALHAAAHFKGIEGSRLKDSIVLFDLMFQWLSCSCDQNPWEREKLF